MNIIPDGSVLCIECGKPISKKKGISIILNARVVE